MVKQDAVTGIHVVSLAIVDCDPVGVELGDAVGTAGIERSALFLWYLLYESI